MKNFTPFQEALYNINFIAFHIEMTVKLGNEQKITEQKDKFLIERLMQFNLIQTCSLLEEYKIIERLAKDNREIMDTTKILSPFIRRIRKYKGLEKFRNIILAHTNRDKSGNFTPYWRIMKDKEFPRSYNDINLITNLILGIAKMLEKRHGIELQEIKKELNKERIEIDRELYESEKSVKTREEFLIEKDNLILEMAKIAFAIEKNKNK